MHSTIDSFGFPGWWCGLLRVATATHVTDCKPKSRTVRKRTCVAASSRHSHCARDGLSFTAKCQRGLQACNCKLQRKMCHSGRGHSSWWFVSMPGDTRKDPVAHFVRAYLWRASNLFIVLFCEHFYFFCCLLQHWREQEWCLNILRCPSGANPGTDCSPPLEMARFDCYIHEMLVH